MAKRGLKRGRWIVFGGLIVFVIVATAVIARRSLGHSDAIAITQLTHRKALLESERLRLTQKIRDNSSRSVIVPLAEQRLGMHLAAEGQIVVLSGSKGSADAH
jgi:hypothetical protein